MFTLSGLGRVAFSAEDVVAANRLEYRLAQLEQRTGELAVSQAVLRQQLLDAGPELSRRTCDGIALKMRDPGEFGYLRGLVQAVEKDHKRMKLSAAQVERPAREAGRGRGFGGLHGAGAHQSIACSAEWLVDRIHRRREPRGLVVTHVEAILQADAELPG